MAIKRPDIYEHNNPLYAISDSNFVRGGFRTAVADLTALYALSPNADQLKEHSTVVYVTAETKYYMLVDIGNIGNTSGWEEFQTGGGSGTISGATNGLSLAGISGATVILGGNLTGGTTVIDGLGTANFTFNNINDFQITPSGSSNITFGVDESGLLFTFTGGSVSYNDNGGMKYANDYSGNYSPRSLIDKAYADAIVSGLKPKKAVRVATVSGITLTGLQTIDGIALANGNRVLVKNQGIGNTGSTVNGIYIASASTWQRADDFDGLPTGEVSSGSYAWVLTGNTNAYSSWVVVTEDPITIDVTPIEFAYFNHVVDVDAGHGIDVVQSAGAHIISVNMPTFAGNSLYWTGSTCFEKLNVDTTTGTLSIALAAKLDKTTFNSYTGTTAGVINSAVTGGTNGLTKSGRNIKLGGILSAPTTISGASYNLSLGTAVSKIGQFNVDATTGAKIIGGNFTIDLSATGGIITDGQGTPTGLEYAGDYSANYCPRSIPDVSWVSGQISTNGVQTVNNGLTKYGTNAVLGGALTGNTNITGAYTLGICSGALLSTDAGYQISGTTILRIPRNNFGDGNLALGYNGLLVNTTGLHNTSLGTYNLQANTTGSENTAIGYNVIAQKLGSYGNVGIGYGVLAGIGNGSYNIGIGCTVLNSNTTGNYNVAIGTQSLTSNQAGSCNTAIGSLALMQNTAGSGNVAIGMCAGFAGNLSNRLFIANCASCSLISGDFTGKTVNLDAKLTLGQVPTIGGTSDVILVRNSGGEVRTVTQSSVGMTTAVNGVCVNGNNFVLGGSLTGNTVINTANNSLKLQSNSSCGLADFSLNSTYANSKFGLCSTDGTAIWGVSGNSVNIISYHCQNSSNGSSISVTNTGLTLTNKCSSVDKTVKLGVSGLTYAADYCSSYSNRSLVDKEYVDTQICSTSNVMKYCQIGNTYNAQRYDDVLGVSGLSYISGCKIYLYPTPVLGQRISIVDVCGCALIDPISIDGNGKCINKFGSCSIVNTDFGAVTFIYNGVFWSTIAFVN